MSLPAGRGPIPGSRPRGYLAAKQKAEADAKAAAKAAAIAEKKAGGAPASPAAKAPKKQHSKASPASSSSSAAPRSPSARRLQTMERRPSVSSVGSAASAASLFERAPEEKSMREVPDTMVDGMRELLQLHNLDELAILCDDIGLLAQDRMDKPTRIDRVFSDILVNCPKYHFVLSRIWEGILIEYWRSLGKTIKSYKWDIRQLVLDWWNRGRVIEVKGSEFQQVYVGASSTKPTAALIDRGVTTDHPEKLAEALTELQLLETDVKECERRIRFARDFDAIMDFFAAVADLRRFESELRNKLIMDLSLTEKRIRDATKAKDDAEELALGAKSMRFEIQTKIQSMKYVYEKQVKQADRDARRIASLEKDLASMKADRNSERDRRLELGREFSKFRETADEELTDARDKLKRETVQHVRLKKTHDEMQTEYFALQRDHTKACAALDLATKQVDYLVEEAAATEAVTDFYATALVGDGTVNAVTGAEFDGLANTLRTRLTAKSSKGKKGRKGGRR